MILGIVGSEAAKFTAASEKAARKQIRTLLKKYKPEAVVSGGCHLGGVDIWAVEEAKKLGIPVTEYLPKKLSWEYYKRRNIVIAEVADITVCITVNKLPASYRGMRFPLCYHCNTTKHIKSGGCWTTKYARSLGKEGYTITIGQSE